VRFASILRLSMLPAQMRRMVEPVVVRAVAALEASPGGAELTSTGNIDQGHIVYYRADRKDCSACSLKPRCTTAPTRKVTRDINEDVRDRVRALANTEAFRQSARERKKVEMRFAHMKRIFRLDRLRLRGLSGAKDEVLLTATVQNLRRLTKLLCRPPPAPAACLA
jgi:Transposase DDE domain